jgi:hypothetical protein
MSVGNNDKLFIAAREIKTHGILGHDPFAVFNKLGITIIVVHFSTSFRE